MGMALAMLQIRSTAYELHSLFVFVLHLFCASLFQILFTSSGPFLVLSAAGTSAFNNVGSLTTAIPSDSPDKNRPKFSAPLASGSYVIHTSNFLSLFQSSLSLSPFCSIYLALSYPQVIHFYSTGQTLLQETHTLCLSALPRSRERSS